MKKLLYASLLAMPLLFACHKKEPVRYKVEQEQGIEYLIDSKDSSRRVIDNGLTGSLKEYAAILEAQPGSDRYFSRDYKLGLTESMIRKGYGEQIFARFPEEEKQAIITEGFQQLPDEHQWELAQKPMKQRVRHGWEQFKIDMQDLYDDARGKQSIEDTKITKESTKPSRLAVQQSYQTVKEFLRGEAHGSD